ncbi:hypothetical protein F5B21DRAFT_111925 [Xylaria acuta]|nr:hypothetical protein F5B21DRAFT_111925 [Xylaria acuta]
MRSATIFASALAFAASILGQVLEPSPIYSPIYFPYENQTVRAGTLYTIEWDAREMIGPATLSLLGGNDPSTLHLLSIIAKVDVNDAEYKWPVSCSLGEEKTYILKIASDLDDGKTYGISPPFHIKGPGCHSTYSGGPSSYPPKPTSHPCKHTSHPTV